jgi:transportin-3
MASKEGAAQAFAPVLAAVATMQGNVPRSEKTQAHEFLEKFQKSVCPAPSWSTNSRTNQRIPR